MPLRIVEHNAKKLAETGARCGKAQTDIATLHAVFAKKAGTDEQEVIKPAREMRLLLLTLSGIASMRPHVCTMDNL
jgi:hypothetical protein